LVFSQWSYNWQKLKLYIGLENILNVKQPNPIMSATNPLDPSFDATMVWGPITGINIYGGLTYTLKKSKK